MFTQSGEYVGARQRQPKQAQFVGCDYTFPVENRCDDNACDNMCSSVCLMWFFMILKCLCCLLVLAGMVLALIWLYGIRGEVRDVSQLKKCDRIGSHLHKVLFHHYDSEWVHDHVRHDTVVCVDTMPRENYTGHDGIKRLACHLQSNSPHGGVHYHASYASADCDNSCVVVFRHDCSGRVWDPYRQCDENDDHDAPSYYDDHGHREEKKHGKDWRPNDDVSCSQKKHKHYHKAWDHGSVCDDCYSSILVNLDDYCYISDAHFCYSKHVPYTPPPPAPSPP